MQRASHAATAHVKGMAALGRVVLAKRERVIMLEPCDKGLMGTTLRYPYEIRDSKEYFDDSKRRVAPESVRFSRNARRFKGSDIDAWCAAGGPSAYASKCEPGAVRG